MATLYRYGNNAYFYMNRNSELYGWNDLYYDWDCTRTWKHIYGKELSEGSYLKEPPILFRQEAITNIVRANLHRNELRYMLWEIEKATKAGKYEFEIKLENALSEDSFNCIKLLGYNITPLEDCTYKIGV